MVAYVIQIINIEDIFGLKEFDNEHGRETLLTMLGKMATTMYHSHLFVLHTNKSVKLTDISMHSIFCPRPGEHVSFAPQVYLLETLPYIDISHSFRFYQKS